MSEAIGRSGRPLPAFDFTNQPRRFDFSNPSVGPNVAPNVALPPPRCETAVVFDKPSLLKVWLAEQIARKTLTPEEADKVLEGTEDQVKLWGGPIKDGSGNALIFARIARDFRSWWGAQVRFVKSSTGADLVIFNGWPAGRKLITGTRYRLDNPKIMELQIGRPGLVAAAKESARLGLVLAVAVDLADAVWHRDLGLLLGHLTVDVPSVLIASAIAGAAGSMVASASGAGILALVGGFALGPVVVAFGVGVAVGVGLYYVDQYFHLTDKVTEVYHNGLEKLEQAWHELGNQAPARFRQLANSTLVHDLGQDVELLASKIGRQRDIVRAELARLW